MEIYAYCIMPSHIHLIFRAKYNNPSDVIRDFKTFTSKKIVKMIEENPQESRKDWLLWMFKRAGEKKSNVKNYQFWQQDNHPIAIYSLSVFEEKLNYIHQNPVKSGFWWLPQLFSSVLARPKLRLRLRALSVKAVRLVRVRVSVVSSISAYWP